MLYLICIVVYMVKFHLKVKMNVASDCHGYLQDQPENLATAKQVSIDTAMQYCEVRVGCEGGGRCGNGINNPPLAHFCTRGRWRSLEEAEIHLQLAFAREGGGGGSTAETQGESCTKTQTQRQNGIAVNLLVSTCFQC